MRQSLLTDGGQPGGLYEIGRHWDDGGLPSRHRGDPDPNRSVV